MSVLKRLEAVEKSKKAKLRYCDVFAQFSTAQLREALENPSGNIASKIQKLLSRDFDKGAIS